MYTYRSLNKTQYKFVYQDPAGAFPWTDPILFDENGSQGPFYFQFDSANPDDLYYLEIRDSQGVLQWTIDNFSPSGSGGSVVTTTTSIQNLIVNNVLWRHNNNSPDPLVSTQYFIAPGASAGASSASGIYHFDIVFYKNNLAATDKIEIVDFVLGDDPIPGKITPDCYLKYACTNSPVGETFKQINYLVSNGVQSLSDIDVCGSIVARSNSGSTDLTIYVVQFFGSGTGASDPVLTVLGNLTLTSDFQEFDLQASIPSASGKVIGKGGNDGIYYVVSYPIGVACDIDYYSPTLYLGTQVPQTEYLTKDMIDSVISSPRTGDMKMGYSNFNPGGWLIMNDTTFGGHGSAGTQRQNNDTWPLFSNLWASTSNTYVPVFNSAGVPVSRGATAIADFDNLYSIALPKALGRVMAGANPNFAFITKYFTASGSTLIINDSSPYLTGDQVIFESSGSLPSPLSPGTPYYLIVYSPTVVAVASTLDFAIAGSALLLTTPGSGVMFFTATLAAHNLAQYVGEYSHLGSVSGPIAPFTPGAVPFSGGASYTNVTQPTTFVNYWIKL